MYWWQIRSSGKNLRYLKVQRAFNVEIRPSNPDHFFIFFVNTNIGFWRKRLDRATELGYPEALNNFLETYRKLHTWAIQNHVDVSEALHFRTTNHHIKQHQTGWWIVAMFMFTKSKTKCAFDMKCTHWPSVIETRNRCITWGRPLNQLIYGKLA